MYVLAKIIGRGLLSADRASRYPITRLYQLSSPILQYCSLAHSHFSLSQDIKLTHYIPKLLSIRGQFFPNDGGVDGR